MPEVEFRVLCADRKDACERVKERMSDFKKLENASQAEPYDHYGKRRFESVRDAITRRNKLLKESGNDIKGIELVIS